MYSLAEINIYPVKSLKGIALNSAEVTDRGLKYDRRWLITDEDNKFITQRTHPELAFFDVRLNSGGLELSHRKFASQTIKIPLDVDGEKIEVSIWDDRCAAIDTGRAAGEWFGDLLGFRCRLVYMPDDTNRFVDRKYASNNEIASFADAYQFLIIGQESLNDLNSRLEKKLPMHRFRPNFVFSGGAAFDEDGWGRFRVGDVLFSAVKPCSRCVFTTVDQETGIRGDEPLRTLSAYRIINNKVMFGQNLLHEGSGEVSVGDRIEIIESKPKLFP